MIFHEFSHRAFEELSKIEEFKGKLKRLEMINKDAYAIHFDGHLTDEDLDKARAFLLKLLPFKNLNHARDYLAGSSSKRLTTTKYSAGVTITPNHLQKKIFLAYYKH